MRDITNQITKTKEKVFKTTKAHQVKEIQLLKKDTRLQEHTSTRHHKEEMDHQLIQQATNRWRAILTTEGANSSQ